MNGDRVIVIEDDRSFVQALTLFLEDQGYRVTKALSGRDGIEVMSHEDIDVAIIDVHLSDMLGTTVANELRRTMPGVPIIMISSDDSSENVRRCSAIDSVFLAKPIKPETLLEAIDVSLRGKDERH